MILSFRPEEVYATKFLRIPSRILRNTELRSNLSNAALLVYSFFLQVEHAALHKHQITPQHTIWFVTTKATVLKHLNIKRTVYDNAVKQLLGANIVQKYNDSFCLAPDYSGYIYNQEEEKYIRRAEPWVRIPESLITFNLTPTCLVAYGLILTIRQNSLYLSPEGKRLSSCPASKMARYLGVSLKTYRSVIQTLISTNLIDKVSPSLLHILGCADETIREYSPAPVNIDETEYIAAVQGKNQQLLVAQETKPAPLVLKQESNHFQSQVPDINSMDGSSISSNPSVTKITEVQKREDPIQKSIQQLKEQISFDTLDNPENHAILTTIIAVMNWVSGYKGETLTINGRKMDSSLVRDKYDSLTRDHIVNVLRTVKKTSTRNLQGFITTALYTSSDHASNVSHTTGYTYADNKYIPSNDYDYEAILEEHRRRLYDQPRMTVEERENAVQRSA